MGGSWSSDRTPEPNAVPNPLHLPSQHHLPARISRIRELRDEKEVVGSIGSVLLVKDGVWTQLRHTDLRQCNEREHQDNIISLKMQGAKCYMA